MFRILLIVLFFSSPAYGGTNELDSLVSETAKLEKQQLKTVDRLEIVHASIRYWRSFLDDLTVAGESLPPPPEESTGDTSFDLLRSPKYAYSELSKLAAECLQNYEILARAVDVDTEAELYFWIKVMGCYNVPRLTESWIKKANVRDESGELITIYHFGIINETIIDRVSISAYLGK